MQLTRLQTCQIVKLCILTKKSMHKRWLSFASYQTRNGVWLMQQVLSSWSNAVYLKHLPPIVILNKQSLSNCFNLSSASQFCYEIVWLLEWSDGKNTTTVHL